MNIASIDKYLQPSFTRQLNRNQERKFRTEAKKRRLKLPNYVCTNGLVPYFYTGIARYNFDYNTINLAVLFIENHFTSRETFNTKIHSYRLKHIVEEKIGCYISNGEFIIAMTTCGYKYKAIEHDNPNCYFNISHRPLKKLVNNAT
jgi:hypothetical protein